MEALIVDWLNLLGRWVHMITGIAWIGASFYFIWLDNHLKPAKLPADSDKGVGGELWAVHGGGFYHAQKYSLAPPELPETLHWFKWEAYTTWLSGIFMLALMYWYGAEIYLIDPSIADISQPVAVFLGILTLVLGWLVYDQLCKSKLNQDDRKLGAVLFAFIVIVAWGLCQVFSGRGAYIHFGAMLGTIMVANVFFVIMPGQRAMVAATQAGRAPDPKDGLTAKQRSVHNTYFTLPVLFVMISNHYAMTYGHAYNWLVLVAICLAGALIRIYFVQRHFDKNRPVFLIAAAILLLLTSLLMLPKRVDPAATASLNPAELFAQVQQVVQLRCVSCHSAKPTQPGFIAPPKGFVLDTAEDIVKQAPLIHQQAVVTKIMPIGNLTQMTEQERQLLDLWVQAGAKAE